MLKKLSVFFLILFALVIANISPVKAVELWTGPDGFDTEGKIKDSQLAATDPREMVANGIRIFLGFLGLLAVVLILYAGFLWMTDGGSEKNIEKAKKILSAAVIGLIIILMSYGLATFVLNQIKTATGS